MSCLETIIPAECLAEDAGWRHCGGPAVEKERAVSITSNLRLCSCYPGEKFTSAARTKLFDVALLTAPLDMLKLTIIGSGVLYNINL